MADVDGRIRPKTTRNNTGVAMVGSLVPLVGVVLLAVLASGCTTAVHPAATQSAQRDIFPFSLSGQDTHIQLSFDKHPPITVPYKLQDGDICYLPFDNGIIICAHGGSVLKLDDDEAVTLIEDNPLWHLYPANQDAPAKSMVQMYGTIFLIAGSMDRLPGALADYLDDPGPNRSVAMAMVKNLLEHDGADLGASARGGTFAVTLRLTDAGRKKLRDAIAGKMSLPENGIMLVKSHRQPRTFIGEAASGGDVDACHSRGGRVRITS